MGNGFFLIVRQWMKECQEKRQSRYATLFAANLPFREVLLTLIRAAHDGMLVVFPGLRSLLARIPCN